MGVLAYVLLSGYSPFAGDNKQETFCNISQCCLSFPDELFDGVSSNAKDFIQATLVKDPRYKWSLNGCNTAIHMCWMKVYSVVVLHHCQILYELIWCVCRFDPQFLNLWYDSILLPCYFRSFIFFVAENLLWLTDFIKLLHEGINTLPVRGQWNHPGVFALKLPQLKRSASCWLLSITFVSLHGIKCDSDIWRNSRLSHDINLWSFEDHLRSVGFSMWLH